MGRKLIPTRQPIKDVLYERAMSISGTARVLRIDFNHLYCAAEGRVCPSPETQAKLVDHLGIPIEQLFLPELLAVGYSGPRGRTGPRRAQPAS